MNEIPLNVKRVTYSLLISLSLEATTRVECHCSSFMRYHNMIFSNMPIHRGVVPFILFSVAAAGHRTQVSSTADEL